MVGGGSTSGELGAEVFRRLGVLRREPNLIKAGDIHLIHIQNPFEKLLAKANGGVLIKTSELYVDAEGDV